MRRSLLILACLGLACSDSHPDPAFAAAENALSVPFSWKQAGVLVLQNDPLQVSGAQLRADHFSWVAQYAMNGCANNTAPYGCAANGCTFPDAPGPGEIGTYAQLQAFIQTYRAAGLYVGLWGATSPANNVEAEAHCFAEVANTLRSTYGAAPDFLIVDAEKPFETDQTRSQRYVTTFNATLAFAPAKAWTPECHIDVPVAPWLNGGFTSIQPQAYWNDVAVNPAYCIDWWTRVKGVPLAKVQPMFDGYRHGAPHTWQEYAADMRTTGDVGFSIWRPITAAETDGWKLLIEQSPAMATYEGQGGCTDECASGARRCSDATHVQACGNHDADACLEWGAATACAAGKTCSGGVCGTACTDACAAGAKRCVDGDRYEECGKFNGSACTSWSGPLSCTASWPGTTCANGYCVGSTCSDACAAGAKRCVDGDRYEECGKFNGDACTSWSGPLSCTASWPGTTCANGYCVGPACSDACAAGAKRCVDAEHAEECGKFDGSGCTKWGAPSTCASGTSCVEGDCVGSGCADECSLGASRCADDGHFQACRASGASGCPGWDAPAACPDDARCVDGACVAPASPDAGIDTAPPAPAGCGCGAFGADAWMLVALVRARRRRPTSSGT